jgi:hypothetical protein
LILLALPYGDDAITFPPKTFNASRVSASIVTKFGKPKLAVRFGYRRFQTTSVMMPKTPIYENGPAFRAVREIRTAGKLLDVFAIVDA